MPTYTVKDSRTGRTVRLSGDSPPTPAELEAIFAGLPPLAPPPLAATAGMMLPSRLTDTQPAQSLPSPTEIVEGIGNLGVGVGKGAYSTVMHGGDLIRQGVNLIPGVEVDRPLFDADVQARMTPEGTMQSIGKGAEQIAEFAIPGMAVAKFVGKAPAIAHALSQGATAFGVGAVQSGDLEGGIAPAVFAGALPLASPVLRFAANKTMAQGLSQSPQFQPAIKRTADILDANVPGRRSMVDLADNYISPSAESIKDARKVIVDDALGRVGPPGARSRVIIETRTPPDWNLTELGVVGSVPGYFVNPGVGAAAAAGRLAYRHAPVQTARTLERLANILNYSGTAGAALPRTASASPSAPLSGMRPVSAPHGPIDQERAIETLRTVDSMSEDEIRINRDNNPNWDSEIENLRRIAAGPVVKFNMNPQLSPMQLELIKRQLR